MAARRIPVSSLVANACFERPVWRIIQRLEQKKRRVRTMDMVARRQLTEVATLNRVAGPLLHIPG
jgi:hypothetical protein